MQGAVPRIVPTMARKLSEEEIDRLAEKRARSKLGWYLHACIYLLVNGLMFTLTALGHGRAHWTMFPALGWGVGLLFHGISVFVLGRGSELRERMVERERERLRDGR